MSDSPEKEGYVTADLSFEPEQESSGDTKRKRSEDLDESSNEFKKNRSESPDSARKEEQETSAAPVTAYTAADALGDTAIAAGAAAVAATGGYSAAVPGSEGNEIVTETTEIAQEKVGQVIGSKGAIIQDLQARTACKIQVNQDFPPGVPRQVVYTGTKVQVNAAKELIALILEKGPTAIHMLNGPVVTQVIECAQPLVGRVIGTGGCNIRDIQLRCGVKIQVHQDFPENVPRQVEITGNQQSVNAAAICVRAVMDGTSPGVGMPGMGGMPMPMGGGMPMGGVGGAPVAVVNGMHVVECAKQYVGRIIGRAGETINILQAKSGARVQIDQKVPEGMPCKVNITGAPDSVNLAIQMVQEILSQGPNRLSMYPDYQSAYGGQQMGGYGAPAGGAGGYYGGGQQQVGGYGGGYGAPAQGGGYYQQQQQPQGYYQQQQGGYQLPAAAAAPAAASGAAAWTEHKTDDGISYWYNASTGVSQWERP